MVAEPVTRKESGPYFSYSYCLLLLSVLVFIIYRQVIHFDFISIDDNIFVFQNPHLRHGLTKAALSWAWTADLFQNSPHVEYWQPMTAMSRLLDAHFFGMNPAGHHFVNFILHWINTLLVFAFFARTTRQLLPSLITAALFAVHPLHVEDVAWITARKDLLGLFFGLLGLHAYAFFAVNSAKRFYIYALVFFIFALLSKPVMICLPLLMLGLDYWPLKRSGEKKLLSLLIEKIPFAAGSAAMVLVTVFCPLESGVSATWKYGSTATFWSYPLRFGEQLYRFFIPVNLNLYQSHDRIPEISRLSVAASIAVLGFISIAVFYFRRQKPFWVTGWTWFLAGILPTMNSMWSANRFMYLPGIGLAVMIAWGLQNRSRLIGWSIALWIGVLACAAFVQTRYWRNDFTLFQYTLKVEPDNTKAHYVLGTRFYAMGNWEQALAHFKAAWDVLDEPAGRAGAAEWLVRTYLEMGNAEAAAYFEEQRQYEIERGNYAGTE